MEAHNATVAASGRTPAMLERERELSEIDHLIADAESGEGRVAVIEGPAGIGKSRLLVAAREQAADRMTVLTARCSELEREFPFGAVRQLFEGFAQDPEARERLFSGAAEPAGSVFGVPDANGEHGDASFAALHGLFWVALNLSEERPLLMAVDDLQWMDRPSLRFFAYLVRRLEGVPVLVATTLRSAEPGTDPALLAEIGGDPATVPLRPGPLSEAATVELVRRRLGADAAPSFCAACHDATGGNPLLLGQLLGALEADRVAPTAENASNVREIGPRAVSRTVLLRLARASEDAIAVARAAAILGEGAELPVIARVAGLEEERAAVATGELVRAEILSPDAPLGFVHPLVRDAVYGELPPGQRELHHAKAAEVLAEAGAPSDRLAPQLLEVPRRGDAAVVEMLREAASDAGRRGAPESAVAYLRRALEEPPEPEAAPGVLFELGIAESTMNAPAAVEHLRAAQDRLAHPAAATTAAMTLAQTLIFTGRPTEGARLARNTAANLPPGFDDARCALVAIEHAAVFFGGESPELLRGLERYRGGVDGDGPGAKMLTAATAFAWTVGGGPADACEALALDALADGVLLRTGNTLFWVCALIPLTLSESTHASALMEEARAEGYRRGSVFVLLSVALWTGAFLLQMGELEQAEQELRQTIQLEKLWGSSEVTNAWAVAFMAGVLGERGDLAGATELLDTVKLAPGDHSDGALFWRRSKAFLLLAEGKPEEALQLAEDMRRFSPHVVHPAWNLWRSLKAQALYALGRRDEGIALMREEVERAREWGAPSVVGRCLRQLGEMEGEAGIDHLREATDCLSRSHARLEHAIALSALGTALRRRRQPTEAREPLRHALELAEACGVPPLVEHVRSELYATGARPRTNALGGPEALTAREMRVAGLAADGATNRDIAETLFVTPKTVEVHLSNAYRKLGIRSRRELSGALTTG
jgi:DNA-binding CsgD family transcriptional regulator/mono/diheme cytochrome c family protein